MAARVRCGHGVTALSLPHISPMFSDVLSLSLTARRVLD
jgi:hypothetical protein